MTTQRGTQAATDAVLTGSISGKPGPAAHRDPRIVALARRGAVPDPNVRATARAILTPSRPVAARQSPSHRAVSVAGSRMVASSSVGRSSRRPRKPSNRHEGCASSAAIANVRRFAETQLPVSTTTRIVPGVEIERRWVPVGRVGAYVPVARPPTRRRW